MNFSSLRTFVPKRYLPWLLLLLALMIHLGAIVRWSEQAVYPGWSWHNNALSQTVYAMVLTGQSRVSSFPASAQTHVPVTEPGTGTWGLIWNSLSCQNETTDYFSTASVYDLLSSLPAVVLGIRPTTIQIGTVVPLAILLATVFLVVRRFSDPATAVATSILVTLVPVTVGATHTAYPALGFMVGPSIAVTALLSSDRFRRLGWVVVAALSTVLATRWGESAGDAVRALFAITSVALVLGASLLLRGTRLRNRGFVGLLVYVTSSLLLLDLSWLYDQTSGYVLTEATAGGSLLQTLNPARVVIGLYAYAVVIRETLLGLPATVVVLAGLTSLAFGARLEGKRNDLRLRFHVGVPGQSRNTKVQLLALGAWFALPLIPLAVSDSKQPGYAIGLIPPLLILAVFGLRSIPRIGRFLPWVAILVLVPTFLAFSSPSLMTFPMTQHVDPERSRLRWSQMRLVMSLSCREGLRDVAWQGFENTPLYAFLHPDGTYDGLFESNDEAWRWSSVGEGARCFTAMPPGSLVLVPTGESGPFSEIGSLIQATYPDLVFRVSPVVTNNPFALMEGVGPSDFPSTIDKTYILMVRALPSDEGPPLPPERFGRTLELAVGEQMALYRYLP